MDNSFEHIMQHGGNAALRAAAQFFVRDDPVHRTLRSIKQRLEDSGIAYAIAGGMALVAHGYDRTTVDIDVLVTEEGLAAVHKQLEGCGYVPPFAGSPNLRDTETGVRVEFIVTGHYPGDDKPKPVAFPDPRDVSIEIGGIRFLDLPTLIELKLASGMTNPGRLKDLADVQELIRCLRLPADFADKLDPFVRERYAELWTAVAGDIEQR